MFIISVGIIKSSKSWVFTLVQGPEYQFLVRQLLMPRNSDFITIKSTLMPMKALGIKDLHMLEVSLRFHPALHRLEQND